MEKNSKPSRIFIIEKNRIVGLDLQKKFESNDYIIHRVFSPIDAEKIMEHEMPNLIVADIEIQKQIGYTNLKKYFDKLQLPIIYINSSSINKLISDQNSNIIAIFPKPFDSEDLASFANKILKKEKPKRRLSIPNDKETYEGELATFWFNENGILYASAKNTSRTVERQKANYEFISKLTNGKKVCLLADTTQGFPQDKATRDYTAKELPNVFLAMAIISETTFGRIIANTFLALKQQPIPIRLFDTENEAKDWLKQFLNPQSNEKYKSGILNFFS